MKIVILGAGRVGSSLAESLASERMDVTVVDRSLEQLAVLREKLDIATVHGLASHPEQLEQAGLEDADMLVAVTASDEVNMLACQIAHSLYHTPTKICRVRASAYTNHKALFDNNHIPVDVIISPEKLVTEHIIGLLKFPGTLQVIDFADNKVQLVAVRTQAGDKFIGETLYNIRKMTPRQDARVAAIFRGDRSINPTRETIVEPQDEVFYVAATKNIRPVMQELGQLSRPYKSIIIAGGGGMGLHLAQALEHQFNVKLIESDPKRAEDIAQELHRTIVLQGSASNTDLLNSENISSTDVFIALTNDDEVNIMSSLLAKKLGARKVISLIANSAYVDLLQGSAIDVAFAPEQLTLGSLLKHVRRGDTAAVHSLRRGAAEALEIVAHGDSRNSRVIGRCISEIDLPNDVRIGALVRGDKVLIAHQDIVIEPEDHVIVFLADKTQIPAVEALFQVGLGFF